MNWEVGRDVGPHTAEQSHLQFEESKDFQPRTTDTLGKLTPYCGGLFCAL